jgi:hypothetical protein
MALLCTQTVNIISQSAFRTVHFLKVNKKQTNALIIQCTDTQHTPTCFGTLKYHHQEIKHDPAEIGAQCRKKQRWMEAVYCNWRRDGPPSRRQLQYTVSIHLCFSRHWAPISSKIMFDSLMMAF